MTPRDAIQGLSDREAVEYLLSVSEDRERTLRARAARLVDRWSLPLDGTVGVSLIHVLLLLWDRRGRIVTRDALEEAVASDGGYVSYGLLATRIKRVRRLIEGMGWPIKIETAYCLGWRLILLDRGWNLETDNGTN